MKIKILGTGCAKCRRLEENVRSAIQQIPVDVEVEKIEDLDDIINYGIMITPALVVDDEVISVGNVPNVPEIRKILEARGIK
ncbi:MAG: TM0996/MTH895 family glutaredoxin-like protein [Candidatus Cloacimonetes bacterium]|nr:TM0996/MTH895 family glutaredoxin-like protein [Candidatus Cloacimonadota bacterium]